MQLVIVVGLDLSLTSTGIAVIREGQVALERIDAPASDDALQSWQRIESTAQRTLRQVPAGALVVLEGPSWGSRFGKPDERHAQRWMVRGPLLACGHEVVVVSPRTRAKYAADDGNAKKRVVLATMRARHPGLTIRDHNVADALALAAMGARSLGSPIDGEPSKQQTEAMGAVSWPTNEGRTA
ncbi:hypothetical protein [Curtobacterium sp. MCBD17_008]|uniref:hypothetical protein n=1 Tax=Curtobacterium sp. MCBD17_008 TaxID=2175656 RepID=UPI000DA95720|nr:hypothetical protein [Curtobacterium sp. MCBD17_008]PZE89969.1 hypothetical protein DEI95_13190 [Curtobacterium sp. MCBD17_008]